VLVILAVIVITVDITVIAFALPVIAMVANTFLLLLDVALLLATGVAKAFLDAIELVPEAVSFVVAIIVVTAIAVTAIVVTIIMTMLMLIVMAA